MAQLHVQKKRNQLWWLWLLIILIVIGVVYYYLVMNGTLPDTFGLKKLDETAIADRNSMLVV